MDFVEKYSNWQDAIELLIYPALGDFVEDFDAEAIADEVLDYQDGGFVPAVDEEEFWEIVQKHNLSV